MSLHGDLLRQARQLAIREPRRPRQASLRRGVSTSYYALFHLLVNEASRLLVSGPDRTELRHCLRRAFGHSNMKTVARQFAQKSPSPKLVPGLNGVLLQPELCRVAASFVDLQQARHEADYDTSRRFTRQEALALIEQAEQAFGDWHFVRGTLPADVFLVGLLAQNNMQI